MVWSTVAKQRIWSEHSGKNIKTLILAILILNWRVSTHKEASERQAEAVIWTGEQWSGEDKQIQETATMNY